MLTDRFGTEIRAGSLITYPVRTGSSTWLTDVLVDRVQGNEIYVTGIGSKFHWGGPEQKSHFEYFKKTYNCQADRARITVVRQDAQDWLEAEYQKHQ